ncbi:MAG TPA: GDP-mannose 4,6-dehydratase [Bacteroidota bacterium]|nr:GDP-mannose 4,6-dehydratase [Bacteroidota bacterium]
MAKAIIFGAGGQDAYYLDQLCSKRGVECIGIPVGGGELHVDIKKFDQVEALVKQLRPDMIFHFAAKSTTRHDALFDNHETISTGCINILESVKRHSPHTKVFVTGSGLQFKNIGKPISENDEFEATSPYSIARIQSVYAARYYRSLGIRSYVGYLFHHESPQRQPHHISRMIALAVKHIASGNNDILELGDISVKKEWTYAGDVVEAIMLLMEQDNIFEAVIGSGKAYSIEYWLECCFSLIGKNWQDYVKIREGYKAEYPILVSNPTLIKSLGWKPKVEIEELAKIMIEQ